MACNSAVVRPTEEYLLPSCSSRDSASDEIVFIMQSLNITTRVCKTANDFKTNSDPVLQGQHHWSYPSQGKTLYRIRKNIGEELNLANWRIKIKSPIFYLANLSVLI